MVGAGVVGEAQEDEEGMVVVTGAAVVTVVEVPQLPELVDGGGATDEVADDVGGTVEDVDETPPPPGRFSPVIAWQLVMPGPFGAAAEKPPTTVAGMTPYG